MSSNWQQEPANSSHSEPNPPRGTGGLLSTYGRLSSQPVPPIQQINQPPNLGSVAPTGSDLLPQQRELYNQQNLQIANGGQYLPANQSSGLQGNSFQTLHDWSGKLSAISNKMAAIAGYSIRPPAPYMERIHPATPETSMLEQVGPWKRSRTLRIMILMRKRRERWSSYTGRIWYSIAMAFATLAVILSSSGVAYGYTYYQSQLPKVQQLALNTITQTTHIYDRNMNLLYNAYDSNGRRTSVTYDEIPQVMQDAMVAAEDHTFWTNSGVDPQGITRAAISFLTHNNSIQGGGSTLTQQVIKNLTGNNQETLNRKLPEAALAVGLTQRYSKQKIMEMYFNVAGFGPLDIGIESAVEEYFHLMPQCDQNFKCTPGIAELDVNQQTQQYDPLLGLARASLLAGLPQNPVIYYPAGGDASKQRALVRQQYVLNQMIQMNMSVQGLGPITPTMAQKAADLMANTTFTPYQSAKQAPHFVDWIINQIETILGNGNPNQGIVPFLTGGFNIRTTINVNLENFVEATVKFHLTQPEFHFFGDTTPINVEHNINDAAVVVMNAHTGEILAMDGSADYNNADIRVGGEYNAADPPANADGTPAGRQPGSTFKPFVYSTAFSMGWYPGMIVPDIQTYFPNGAAAGAAKNTLYHPPDYSANGDPDHYGGNAQATIRVATAQSQNVGAERAMEYAGPENVLTTVHRLGLTQVKNLGVSWALGTENASVLQMVDAYQTFANEGARVPSQGILDIWDNYGHNLYHYDPTHPPQIQVFSPQVAYLMTSVLIDEKSRAGEFGSDHDLSLGDIDSACIQNYLNCQHQVATKTGTTDGPKDNWTVGYTPNVVVGVWSGNANNEAMNPGTLGIVGAAPIWHSVTEALVGYCPSPTYPTVSCPQNYNPTTLPQELGIGQQQTFIPPSGVHQACTSAVNGLLGSDNCDWMIDGEEPLQAGIPPNTNNTGSDNKPKNGHQNGGN